MAKQLGRHRRGLVPKSRVQIYLDEYLAIRGMERKDLAATLDVTEAAVSRWANQKRKLTAEKQRAIEEALDLPAGGLYKPPGNAPSDVLLAGLDDEQRVAALSYIGFLRTRGQ